MKKHNWFETNAIVMYNQQSPKALKRSNKRWILSQLHVQ
jgi:hypothetical protein